MITYKMKNIIDQVHVELLINYCHMLVTKIVHTTSSS